MCPVLESAGHMFGLPLLGGDYDKRAELWYNTPVNKEEQHRPVGQAGLCQSRTSRARDDWIPAEAGMTGANQARYPHESGGPYSLQTLPLDLDRTLVGQGNILYLGRLVGLQGRLARPCWGLMAGWAAGCGALASNRLRWEGAALLTLTLVFILTELAWGSLWDLATTTAWFRTLQRVRSGSGSGFRPFLPYTQPASPAGRLTRGWRALATWWRRDFWPLAGLAVLGLIAALVLTIVLSHLLPERLRPLNAALVALLGLGVFQRQRDQTSFVAPALVTMGLSWLAGTLAFAEMRPASLALALLFSLAGGGALLAADGRRWGLWLLNGALAGSAVVLVVLQEPLAAGALGLLACGGLLSQLPVGGVALGARGIGRRLWPWLMAAMFVAALAVP